MAIFKQGNLWEFMDQADFICITTNATVTSQGKLVMGAGIAKQACKKMKGLDEDFGSQIRYKKDLRYKLLFSEKYPKMIAFQVKFFYADDARYDLIDEATFELEAVAKANPDKIYYLNYPGVGCGNLLKADIEPIINCLPDNVHVWELK